MRIANENLDLFQQSPMENPGTQTVASRIYRVLRDKITTMQMLPGTTMSEQEVADMLGVSRTPVREAFIRLSREKMLIISPQRRTMVSKISSARVRQERFLRESLEQAVLEQFVLNPDPEALARLEGAISLQKEALEAGDFPEVIVYDDAFHQIFYETTDHMLCHQVMRRNCFDYQRLRHLSTLTDVEVQRLNIQQHETIVRLVCERNLTDVQSLLRRHVRRLSDEMVVMRAENPEYFQD